MTECVSMPSNERNQIIATLEAGLVAHRHRPFDSPVILESVIEVVLALLTNKARQIDAGIRTVFELIDAEQFSVARAQIAVLEQQLGQHDSELVRVRALITYLED